MSRIEREILFGQVLIRRQLPGSGYELRHGGDSTREPGELRVVPVAALRSLAQFTASGAFRPLKSAPNLRSGWRTDAENDGALESALHALYPGAVADWFAAQEANPPLTHFREFTERQTGMYRITALLEDGPAAEVIGACCPRQFCLKRRLWTVAGLAADGAEEKSLIPCLEPCALLLEFSRKAMRIEQEEKMRVELGPGELATLQSVLECALSRGDAEVREADFDLPTNPRRLQWLLNRLKPLLRTSPSKRPEK